MHPTSAFSILAVKKGARREVWISPSTTPGAYPILNIAIPETVNRPHAPRTVDRVDLQDIFTITASSFPRARGTTKISFPTV